MESNPKQNSLMQSEEHVNLVYDSLMNELDRLVKATLSEDKERSQNLTELKSQIQNSYTEFNNELVNLILLGNTCSGKTTLINAFLSVLTSPESNFEPLELLPSSNIENTYLITIIEPSKDEFYHLIHSNVKENREIHRIQKSDSNLGKQYIKEYLEELDENASDILSEAKDSDNLDPEVITIKIPGIKMAFRLIDTPGLSSNVLHSTLVSLLTKNYLISNFLFVRDVTEIKAIEEQTFASLTSLINNFTNSQFAIHAWTKFLK